MTRYLKNRDDLNLTNEAPPPAPTPPIIVKCPAFMRIDNQLENESQENPDFKVLILIIYFNGNQAVIFNFTLNYFCLVLSFKLNFANNSAALQKAIHFDSGQKLP